MKETTHKWFDHNPWREGFVGCVLRFPDASTLVKARGPGFSPAPLEKAARQIHEIVHLTEKSGLCFGRICLVYRNALMHVERRTDGISLTVFTVRDEKDYDAASLEKLFSEFQNLQNSDPSPTGLKLEKI